MAKSTAAYRAADTLNKQLVAIAKEFGTGSDIYRTYVNKITASLPASATHVSKKTGVLQVSKGKTSGLTAAQIKGARKGLPSVKKVKESAKRQLAEEKIQKRKGTKTIAPSDIQKEAKIITDDEVKKFISDKDFVKQHQDEKGRIIYNADMDVSALFAQGAKSYAELRAIIEGMESEENAKAQQEQAIAATVEGGYEKGKANLIT